MVWFWNVTGGEMQPLTNPQNVWFVPLQDYIVMGFIALFSGAFLLLFMVASFDIRHMLDRYRLKYGFDRELEAKGFKEPTDAKLNKRESFFKKRVFKD